MNQRIMSYTLKIKASVFFGVRPLAKPTYAELRGRVWALIEYQQWYHASVETVFAKKLLLEKLSALWCIDASMKFSYFIQIIFCRFFLTSRNSYWEYFFFVVN